MRGIEPDGGFWMEGHEFLEFYTHLEVLHYDMTNHKAAHLITTGLSQAQQKRRG